MNKWQAEVQKSLLESEEAAIKALEKQYKAALNEILQKVKLFEYDISMLDEAINTDGMDEATKAVLLSQKRAKVYQQRFQEALYGQISGILERMHGNNYSTIEAYLKGCYEDAYVGTLYDLSNQGIPVITPIDQAAATQAILTDSKVSKGLYGALGVDVGKLKKSIAQEVSRGIASALPYSMIARNIANKTKAPLSRAKTITRTEGHRVQQKSSVDAANEARARGADLVKVWDAVLDGRTRPSHRRVDGEIRELDEKFSNGMQYPGDPSGGAGEVVNCRCIRVHKPRWDAEGGFAKIDNFTGEVMVFESAKDYAEFKERYWSKENVDYMKYADTLEKRYGTKDYNKLLDKMTNREYKKLKELENANPFIKSSKSEIIRATASANKVASAPITWKKDGKPFEMEIPRETKKAIVQRGISEAVPVFADDTENNKFGSWVKQIPKEEGKYDVGLHGWETFTEFFGEPIDAYTLAQIIRQREDYEKGTPIRLFSCYTGMTETTGNCVAQLLANELGVVVEAPSDVLNVYIDKIGIGHYYVGDDINNTELTPFYPRW